MHLSVERIGLEGGSARAKAGTEVKSEVPQL